MALTDIYSTAHLLELFIGSKLYGNVRYDSDHICTISFEVSPQPLLPPDAHQG